MDDKSLIKESIQIFIKIETAIAIMHEAVTNHNVRLQSKDLSQGDIDSLKGQILKINDFRKMYENKAQEFDKSKLDKDIQNKIRSLILDCEVDLKNWHNVALTFIGERDTKISDHYFVTYQQCQIRYVKDNQKLVSLLKMVK